MKHNSLENYKLTTSILFLLCQKRLTTVTTVAIWNYLILRGNDKAIKLDDFINHTGLSKKAVNSALQFLLSLNLIKRERDRATVPYVYSLYPLQVDISKKSNISNEPQSSTTALLLDIYINILDTINISSILDIINNNNITSILVASSKQGGNDKVKKSVKVKTIIEDEDWPTINSKLVKYFTERELAPIDLVYHNRWNRLCLMFCDESFDLNLYAEWYKNNKYNRLGFSWGLFTSKTMREEFIQNKYKYMEKVKREKRRLNTTTKWDKKIDTRWMEEIEDDD